VFVTKTTDERKDLEMERESQTERNTMEKKPTRDTNGGEYLCGCDSGTCFECGI
jgi:hypothetical protein